MEHPRKPAARNRARHVKPNGDARKPADWLALPNITHLITCGDITVGRRPPIGCIATACDEDQCLAMLVRRKDETLLELLTRLDAAIAKAYEENILTDEINPPGPIPQILKCPLNSKWTLLRHC